MREDRPVKALWTWFWTLDRRTPWNAWALIVSVFWIARWVHWATGYPEFPWVIRVAGGTCAALSLAAWAVLYARDAVRGRRERRRERASYQDLPDADG